MSISVLSRTRLFFSVMAVIVFSAMVLVGCGDKKEDNPAGPSGGGGDVNGTYANGKAYIDFADEGIEVTITVSGGNTIKITGTGVDVTFTIDGALKDETATRGADMSAAGYTDAKVLVGKIAGDPDGEVAFASGKIGGKIMKTINFDAKKDGKSYNAGGMIMG